jgi:beta-glucosidase
MKEQSLADILYGDVNPSGRIPYNYPRYTNSLENTIVNTPRA